MIEVHREQPDRLSREVWRFRENGSHGFFLALDFYGIERRKAVKGRFCGARPGDRWSVSDERHYFSGLPRPASIPDDVMREAVSKTTVRVFVGYTEPDRMKAEYAIVAR